MSTFFTSDLHFFHSNIIRFDNRPFSNVDEMNNALISNFNQIIKPDDVLWILGDISFGNIEQTSYAMSQLNCKKRLVKGNHDRVHNAEIRRLFECICDYTEENIDGVHVVMSHYPIHMFDRHHYGSYMLYGHVHNSHEYNITQSFQRSMIETGIPCKMQNVGVMVWDYKPTTMNQIIARQEEFESGIRVLGVE